MNKRQALETMMTWISDEPSQDKLAKWAVEEWGDRWTQDEYMAMAETVSQKWYRAAERQHKLYANQVV